MIIQNNTIKKNNIFVIRQFSTSIDPQKVFEKLATSQYYNKKIGVNYPFVFESMIIIKDGAQQEVKGNPLVILTRSTRRYQMLRKELGEEAERRDYNFTDYAFKKPGKVMVYEYHTLYCNTFDLVVKSGKETPTVIKMVDGSLRKQAAITIEDIAAVVRMLNTLYGTSGVVSQDYIDEAYLTIVSICWIYNNPGNDKR